MIPNRMKSYLGPDAAINSMAQHARPNWKSHSEYDLDQFRSQVTGLGVPNRCAIPIGLFPFEDSLADGVDEAEQEDEDERTHLNQAEPAERSGIHRPRKDEDGFDVEDDEQQAEDVVPDVGLWLQPDPTGSTPHS